MKLKLIALVALLGAAAGSAQAAIADATSGNGELAINFRYYNGSPTTGNNDFSALFDLGVTMSSFIDNRNTAGFTQSFTLTDPNYGGVWESFQSAVGAAGAAAIEFSVVALNNVGTALGNASYLTTSVLNTVNVTPGALNAFQNLNPYILANNTRGTHATEANGASWASSADIASSPSAYYGAVPAANGDNWVGQGPDSTARLNVAQNFFHLAGDGTRAAFGVDLDGNGVIAGEEFGKWTFDVATATLTFANPVPEPETYAMLLAGLGLMAGVARRRSRRQA